MRYVTFSLRQSPETTRLGVIHPDGIVDVALLWEWTQPEEKLAGKAPPETLQALLQRGHKGLEFFRSCLDRLEQDPGSVQAPLVNPYERIKLHAPLIRPPSIRDFYAFEEHVHNAYAIRGESIPDEWYHIPVFYFSNPEAIFAPEDLIPYPRGTNELDYELEVAAVIGQPGRDILPQCAEEHIAGYMIMNDWSARDFQKEETRVRLGPAKAKDFATSLGPWVVTLDEIKERATGRPGVFDLEMVARVNGKERSRGNFASIHFSMGEILARASQNCTLYPGDVIGTGTVGSGCLLEVTRGNGPYLNPGDEVELEVECLGVLKNIIGPSLLPGQI